MAAGKKDQEAIPEATVQRDNQIWIVWDDMNMRSVYTKNGSTPG